MFSLSRLSAVDALYRAVNLARTMTLVTRHRAFLILCLVILPFAGASAAPKETADLQTMMSSDEFKASGLEKFLLKSFRT